MIGKQHNDLKHANIAGNGVDNTNAIIIEQNNYVKYDQKELIKVKIFLSGKVVKVNEEALIMSPYNRDSEFSKGTVTHQGFRVDIDKIDIGKRDTEKLKMELKILEESIADNDYPHLLGCIIDE